MYDYLAHHGILGQKWGKRNGPPYPLSASSHSVSEKKAGWKKSLVNSEEGIRKDKTKKIAIKTLKVTGTVAAGAALGYIGSKAAFNLAVQYYVHKPKVDAALKVIGSKSVKILKDKALGFKEHPVKSLKDYAITIGAGLSAAKATDRAFDKAKEYYNKTQKKPPEEPSVTKTAANEILNDLKGKKISEIDRNELQRSVQFLNNLDRIEQLSKQKR